MGSLLLLAWRNLWRNPRRTLITGSAVALGLAAMIFVTGWAKGLNLHVISTITRSGLGDVQLHARGYSSSREPSIFLKDYKALLARAEKTEGVLAASPRVLGEGLASIGGRSANIRLYGIIPEKEDKVTDWGRRFVAGTYLGKPQTVVIGTGLAKTLEVEIGSKVVLTVADVTSGELRYRLLTVAGIAASNNPLIEKGAALLNMEELGQDLGVEGAHEIALAVSPAAGERANLERIAESLGTPEVEAAPWHVISPLSARMGEIQALFMGITLGVIFFLLGFGIVNTMSMSLIERFHEFGVLKALGTSPGRLFALLTVEAACLGAVGSLGGLSLGMALLSYFSFTGINLGGMEAMGISFKTPVHPMIYPPYIMAVTLAFLVLTPAASVLVSFKAARVDPATALRSE